MQREGNIAVVASDLDNLMPAVYAELKRLAARHLRGQAPGHTLQTTALVHEAYLRLARVSPTVWGDRRRFFALASRAMRSVLVDHARRRQCAKRGLKVRPTLDEPGAVVEAEGTQVIDVDRALHRLEALDSRKAQIVELRYFGGLTVEEAAEVLGVSPVTIHRQWLVARTWLYRELREPDPE